MLISPFKDGMFAILIPVSLSPLIVTLYWAENKAKRLGLVKVDPNAPKASDPFSKRAWHFAEQLDLIGLILLGAAVALILLPLTLSRTTAKGWKGSKYPSSF